MMLWGSLFPLIKIGYKVFGIDTADISDILMFAALRFIICGTIVCAAAYILKSHIPKPKTRNILTICLEGIFAIVLHYGFTYVGLSRPPVQKPQY